MAETAPLPRRRLQQNADPEPGTAGVYLVQCLGHARQAGLLAAVDVGPGVHHEVAQAELLGTLQLDDERLDRTAIEDVVGRREVDQVRVVGRGVAEPGGAEGAAERGDIVVGQVAGLPLVAVLGEELHRVAAEVLGGEESLVIAARDGHVGTEQRHQRAPDSVRRHVVVAVGRADVRCLIVERAGTQHTATRPLPSERRLYRKDGSADGRCRPAGRGRSSASAAGRRR